MEKFRPFFDPKSVVIIGASRNEYTFNGVVLKNLLEAQYKGKLYIVHPFTKSLMGIPCLANVQELDQCPIKPELAIILTQNNILGIIETLGKIGIKYILIETDISVKKNRLEQEQLVKEIKVLINQYKLKVLGPSMIGIIDFQNSFTTSVIPTRRHILLPNKKDRPKSGVSFLAQSGGLTGACGWWAAPQKLPFAKIIHIGKAIDITQGEIFEVLFNDPATDVIILFMKEVTREYLDVLAKYKGTKPVLFKYVGYPSENVKKFEDLGAVQVRNYVELFEFAKVLLWCPPPTANAVGIIGPSSGAINLILAEMREQEIHLAHLEDTNREFILSNIGGSTCELGNPVDYWPPMEFVGTQVCRVYHDASNTLLKDDHVGALFLALEFFTEIEFNFSIFETIKAKYPDKPIICVLIQAEKEGTDRILEIANELHIPVFVEEVERAVRAFRCLMDCLCKKRKK